MARRPLIVSLCQLVVTSPLVVLSLRCPLIILSCQLVVTLPLAVLSSRHPLILLSRYPCPLVVRPLVVPAGCCVASQRTALSSSRRLATSPSRYLVAPAGCCIIISRCHLVVPPSCLLSSHHAGWLLCCLSLRRPSRPLAVPDIFASPSPCLAVAVERR